MTTDLLALATEKRALAARARRLGRDLLIEADRKQMLEHADELDQEADALERQAMGAPPTVGVVHQQQQQQQQEGHPADPDAPESKLPAKPTSG